MFTKVEKIHCLVSCFIYISEDNQPLLMKGTYLGELEELILLTVASLNTEAYAVSVKAELEKNARRTLNISAIHSVLYRLEEKEFLKSSFGGATQKRGGKMKRYFRITAAGLAALKEARNVRENIWKSIPKLKIVKP
jgi:PadR family transcriptional regulator PadR